MRLWLSLFLVVFFVGCTSNWGVQGMEYEDNEFAEFEDFDDGLGEVQNPKAAVKESKNEEVKPIKIEDENDAVVETEEDEFEEWDPDEFEDKPVDNMESGGKSKGTPELKIVKVPFRTKDWKSYYVEISIGVVILIYLINFLIGSSKNNSIASAWLQTNLEFLKSQFEMVGDDPTNVKAVSTHQMVKESEHTYTLWCSGRQCCEGMLVQLKLLKRQDIISNVMNRLTPANDQVLISIRLEHMDPFVFCMGQKRSVAHLQKNMTDVAMFCGDRLKSAEKYGFSPAMCVLSELPGEVVPAVLDSKVAKVLKEHEHLIDSIHISDQFSGLKPVDADETPAKEPETTKVINITLNVPNEWTSVEDIENLQPLIKLSVYLIDKISRLRLTKDTKSKADKHRQEMHLFFLKQTHQQRQETAQLKREEKERSLQEKMMNEEDPEKQRRMDEMIQRRQLKNKNKKMKGKQYKVKS